MGTQQPNDPVNINGPWEHQAPQQQSDQKRRQAEAQRDHAIDNPVGDPRPVYDQYAVNQPEDMHRGYGAPHEPPRPGEEVRHPLQHLDRQQQHGRQEQEAQDGAPAEAVADREAQDHELANVERPEAGDPKKRPTYPAGSIEQPGQDNTPHAPQPSVDWDERVQPPERSAKGGKDRTERGD